MSKKPKNEMGFLDHLEELRGVLFRVVIIALVGMVLCFAFAVQIQAILTLPFDKAAAQVGELAGQLVLLAPTEGFIVRVKIALFAGLILGSPFIFWQIWQFVSPGLYKQERRAALPVVVSASICFLGGAAFGFNILSFATEFFLKFAQADIANQWSLTKYIGFVTRLVFAFGLVFELPLVIFILSRMGLVTPQTLGQYRRHAVLGILVLAAILTPPDPISQMMLAGPVYLLFEISIVISRMVYKKRMQPEKDEGDDPPDGGDGASSARYAPDDDPPPAPEPPRNGPRRAREDTEVPESGAGVKEEDAPDRESTNAEPAAFGEATTASRMADPAGDGGNPEPVDEPAKAPPLRDMRDERAALDDLSDAAQDALRKAKQDAGREFQADDPVEDTSEDDPIAAADGSVNAGSNEKSKESSNEVPDETPESSPADSEKMDEETATPDDAQAEKTGPENRRRPPRELDLFDDYDDWDE